MDINRIKTVEVKVRFDAYQDDQIMEVVKEDGGHKAEVLRDLIMSAVSQIIAEKNNRNKKTA